MIAGATTHASSPIGTVTEAQMARILVKEYCLELAGACSCARSVCVFVMPSASWSRRVQHISRRSRNRTRKYAARMTRMPYFRMMSGATSWWTKLTHSRWLIHNESIPQSRRRGRWRDRRFHGPAAGSGW
jgi:hypothetical protein